MPQPSSGLSQLQNHLLMIACCSGQCNPKDLSAWWKPCLEPRAFMLSWGWGNRENSLAVQGEDPHPVCAKGDPASGQKSLSLGEKAEPRVTSSGPPWTPRRKERRGRGLDCSGDKTPGPGRGSGGNLRTWLRVIHNQGRRLSGPQQAGVEGEGPGTAEGTLSSLCHQLPPPCVHQS